MRVATVAPGDNSSATRRASDNTQMQADRLIQAIIASDNQAADDLLLEALRVGDAGERATLLDALAARATPRGLTGVLAQLQDLPAALQSRAVTLLKNEHAVLRTATRSTSREVKLAAMRVITQGRQGKLAYLLSENLRESDEAIAKAACDALVSLARWVTDAARAMAAISHDGSAADAGATAHRPDRIDDQGPRIAPASGGVTDGDEPYPLPHPQPHPWRVNAADATDTPLPPGLASADLPAGRADLTARYAEVMSQRPEIESAVARAMDVVRTRHAPDVLRAALLLCDWAGSRTLAILKTNRHGGHATMVRRLQQPPAADHVEAFLLGASHGHLRANFGVAFSHITDVRVLDRLLGRTHWLADHQLQLCMKQVTRGLWWNEADLARDLDRRPPRDAVKVAQWVSASGIHDALGDTARTRLLGRLGGSVVARLALLRQTLDRPREASSTCLATMLGDPDERLARIAARELIRRKRPADQQVLLRQMSGAAPSVRRIIGRSLGRAGFEQFFQSFDRMNRLTRRRAGAAMLKLLPDGLERLTRKIEGGGAAQRVRALQIADELDQTGVLAGVIVAACAAADGRVRSKAVRLLGRVNTPDAARALSASLGDADARVRSNAIEAACDRPDAAELRPVLHPRARAGQHRERATAIRALHRLGDTDQRQPLRQLIGHPHPAERIAGMWALRQTGTWSLLGEVAQLARADPDAGARRYALTMIKAVSDRVDAAA